jgi:hypothetical protein
METKILSALKHNILLMDNDKGVDRATFNDTHKLVKGLMGADAADILADAMELGMEGEMYFPNSGEGLLTWKRMVHAYKVEHGLDNEDALVG